MKEFADLVAEWPVVADVNESSERNTEEHEEQVGDCQIEDVAARVVI